MFDRRVLTGVWPQRGAKPRRLSTRLAVLVGAVSRHQVGACSQSHMVSELLETSV